MNKDRRKAIDEAIRQIELARAALDEAKSMIEDIRDEEQEFYDNMPESFQDGDKGQNAQTAIDALEEAISSIEEFDADSVVGQLGDAQS